MLGARLTPRVFSLAAALVLVLTAAAAGQVSGYIRVQALIDGQSRLVVSGNKVHWQNIKWASPGLHLGANRHTDLWTKYGTIPEQYYKWCPIWTNNCNTCAGNCDEHRGPNTSQPFTGLIPPLPGAGISITKMDKIACRSQCTILQQPSASNQYTLIVEFDDNAVNASAIYDVRIHYVVQGQAAYVPFGQGCLGTAGTPSLGAVSGNLPWIGQQMAVEVQNLPTTAPVAIVVGLSATKWGATSLPLDLGIIGMGGCKLCISLDVILPLVNTAGKARWSVAVPNDTMLLGVNYYNQAFVTDPKANALGATLSNAAQGTVGKK